MNIVYLLNHAGAGGSERYVELLMTAVKQKGDTPFLLYNEEGKLMERTKAKGIGTWQLTMKHPFDIRAAFRLAIWCKKNKVEVIHTHYLRENYIAILAKVFYPKVKVIYTNHVMLHNSLKIKMLNKIMTVGNHKVIAVCNLGKEILIKNWIKEEKIKVIFNGIDPKVWEKDENSTLRKELDIAKDTKVLTCLSRFDEFKGNRFLIESIAALEKMEVHKNYVFILSNQGPLWEEMKQLAKELQVAHRIHFLGFRKDVKNILSSSDIYVNPSEWEALSFAVVEAIGSSLPVVSSDSGGTTDIINEQNKCGLLVKYKDTMEMAKAMQKVIDDDVLYSELKSQTTKVIKAQFTIDKMIQDTYEQYSI